MRNAAAGVLAATLAVGAVLVAPPAGAAAAGPPAAVRWSPVLADGETAGVTVVDGIARLTPDRESTAATLPTDGHGDAGVPGLLTLAARTFPAPVDRVDATVAVVGGAVAGTGGTSTDPDVAVDVRGMRPDGGWTEWLPMDPAAAPSAGPSATPEVVFPDPVLQVQARLVLTPGAPDPEVSGLTLAAYPAPPGSHSSAVRKTRTYRIFATREGLVGRTTANGHVIAPSDLFVALPSRRALSPRNSADYSVKVCAPNGRCVFAPVWDVGPWNTRDDYWNPAAGRQTWRDLPQGMPEAQAAKQKGYNKGKDQFGRKVKNPAGIDLSDGLFWGALGLRDNAWVSVEYLWTGTSPLALVKVDSQVDLRDAPDPAAGIVGLVADRTVVPLQCRTGTWVQVGAGQYLPDAVVAPDQWPAGLPSCPGRPAY